MSDFTFSNTNTLELPKVVTLKFSGNPDSIFFGEGGYPFIYDKKHKEVFIGELGESHMDMGQLDELVDSRDYEESIDDDHRRQIISEYFKTFAYYGRITNSKSKIYFWVPDQKPHDTAEVLNCITELQLEGYVRRDPKIEFGDGNPELTMESLSEITSTLKLGWQIQPDEVIVGNNNISKFILENKGTRVVSVSIIGSSKFRPILYRVNNIGGNNHLAYNYTGGKDYIYFDEALKAAKDIARNNDLLFGQGSSYDYALVESLRTASLKLADPYTYTETSGINDGQPMKDKSLMFHTEEATDIDQPVDTMWLEPDINFNDPSNENTINRLDVNDNKILENERKRKKTIAWQKQLTKTYEGSYANAHTPLVYVNGQPLSIEPSLKLRNYSPTGFSWGINVRGSTQLALAMLLDYTGDADFANKYHQQFNIDVIVELYMDEAWSINSDEIDTWVNEKIIKKQAWQIQQDIKEESTWGEIRRKIKEELGYDIFVKPFESEYEGFPFWVIIETPDEFSELPRSIRDIKRNEILLILKQFNSQIGESMELASGNFAYPTGK